MAQKLSNRVVSSLFLKLLPAQIFTFAVQSINSLLNSMIIGNLMGAECLSVIGFMTPLTMVHTMLGGGIAIGSQILCGRYVGRGDQKGVSGVYVAVSAMCVFVGAILTAAYAFFPVQIASLLGATDNTLNYTANYLRGYSWGMIPMMFSTAMIPFLQLNNAQNVMYAAISAMTAANIGVDLLSIRVLDAGMFGIGNAVSCGYAAFVLVVVVFYLFGKCGVRLRLRDFSFQMAVEVVRHGLPEMLMYLCLSIRNLLFNRILLSLGGNPAMSAFAVITNLSTLVDTVNRGINGSANMEASLLYGERDKNSLRELLPVVLRISVPIKTGMYLLIFLFAQPLARLFGIMGSEVPFAATAIRLYMLYPIANLLFSPLNNIYKGLGKTRLAIIINVCNYLIIPVLLMLTLPKLFGINGVWLSIALPDFFTTIGLVIYSAVRRGTFPRRLSEITYIPEEAGLDGKDRFDASIHSPEQASEVPQRVIAFCRRKGMSDVRSSFCGLCVEEIAVAILEHGRKQKINKKCEIDLRMIYENGGVSILMRDNYPPFNPMEWAEMQNPDDPMRSIGIRMVTKAAETVNYSTAINLNVLMIRLKV